MFKCYFIVSWISLLVPWAVSSQTIRKPDPFYEVDSLSKTIRYKNDIYALTKELTGPYSEDKQKVRAIFSWITDNICYDYKFVNRGKEIKMPECTSGRA
jgi:hypothetical protein